MNEGLRIPPPYHPPVFRRSPHLILPTGYGAISAALAMIASLVFWCAIVLIVLAIYGLDPLSVYIPLSTVSRVFFMGEKMFTLK